MPEGQRPDPPAHCAHFVIAGTVGGFPWANTFWVRNGNAQTPSQTDFTTITAAFGTAFKDNIVPALSTALGLAQCSSLYYGNQGADLAGAVNLGGAGGKTGIVSPLNVSLCIGWRVAQHYRGGHPRTYLAGIPADSFQNPRSFTAAYASDIAGRAAGFHTAVNGLAAGAWSLGKLGVVSFVFRKEWRTPPVFRDFLIDSAHVDTRVDSMRRRLGHDVPP